MTLEQKYILDRSVWIADCGCWLWTLSWYESNYPTCHMFGEPKAHRLSFRAFKGEIPEGRCVLHICDTPPCVNPDHLFLGTFADNSADMVRKGRVNRKLIGEKCAHAKLTDAAVREIRILRGKGLSQQAIGDKFGVCQTHVRDILRGIYWSHVL